MTKFGVLDVSKDFEYAYNVELNVYAFYKHQGGFSCCIYFKLV